MQEKRREKLDAVHHNIESWIQDIDAAMNARAAKIAATNAELDTKIQAAKHALIGPSRAYLREKRLFKNKTFPSHEDKKKFHKLELANSNARAIVSKLEKAKLLLVSLQRDDVIRQAEITVQNTIIAPLWTALEGKITRSEDWDDTDHANFKKIERAQDIISDIHAQIIASSNRIAQCHRMAIDYDATHPDKFPGHWLNIASIILEQKDRYGFEGVIDRHDLDSSPTRGSGLEGYCVSQGALLEQGELARYTLPGTKVKIEQDHLGIVRDKTPLDASQQHKMMAAIKTAHLLLLDRAIHPNKQIHLKASADYLPQTKLVFAALQVEAKLAGIVLKSEDIIVEAPGWTNWRGSEITSMADVKKSKAQIEAAINQHHARDDLKDKVRQLKGQTIMVDEPSHPPFKP